MNHKIISRASRCQKKIDVIESLFQSLEMLQTPIINITKYMNKTTIANYYLYEIKTVHYFAQR